MPCDERQVSVFEMREYDDDLGMDSPWLWLLLLRMGASGCGVDAFIGMGTGVLAPVEGRLARDSAGSSVDEEEEAEEELPDEEEDGLE